jgi:hypothetical protein
LLWAHPHPRFGFGVTANSCTCFPHTHHAYGRFDFDVEGPSNAIYEIPLQSGLTAGVPISTERKLFRSDTKPMHYRIRGPKRSYLLYPGENDGNADKYRKGDIWFLHWHDGTDPVSVEIDDGHSFFDATSADLDQFLTGEPLKKEDIVVWYHASFLHTPGDDMGDDHPTPAEGATADTNGGAGSRRA